MITASTLVTISPALLIAMGTNAERAATDAPWLSYAATVFEIDTPLQLGHFLGQIMTETGGGNLMSEVGQGSSTGGRGWIQLTGRSNRAGYTNYLARPSRPDRDRVPYVDCRDNLSVLTLLPHRTHSAGCYWRHPYVDTAGRPIESRLADQIASQGMTPAIVRRITTEVVRPGTPHHDRRWANSQRAYEIIQQGGATFTRCPGGVCPDLNGIPRGNAAANTSQGGSDLFWNSAGSRYSLFTPATFGGILANTDLPDLGALGGVLTTIGLGGLLASDSGNSGGVINCVTEPCVQPEDNTILGLPPIVAVGGGALALGLAVAALNR